MGASSLESFALDVGIIFFVGLLTFFVTYLLCYCCPVELGDDQVSLTENESNSNVDSNLRNIKPQSPLKFARHIKITVVPRFSHNSDVGFGSNSNNRKFPIKKSIAVVPFVSNDQENNEREQKQFNRPVNDFNHTGVMSYNESKSTKVQDRNDTPVLYPVSPVNRDFSNLPYNPYFAEEQHSSGNGTTIVSMPPSAPPLSVLSM